MPENVSRTLKVLIEIRDDLRGVKQEVQEMKDDIRGMKDEVRVLSTRLDNVFLGAHRDDHVDLRQRVERIEAHLGLER